MDIFEDLQKVNEQDDLYRNNVELSVHFESSASGISDLEVDAPKTAVLVYEIEVEHRSWGIKDINVTPRSMDEFEVVVHSNLPEEEGKEEVILVKVDFLEIDATISWLEGSGIAPVEVHVTLGKDNRVVSVEIDFFYWKP